MQDDLDAQLLRRFALAAEPLGQAAFTEQVMARLARSQGLGFSARGLYALLGTIASGLATGISVPLRVRHAWLMLSGAVAVSVWTLI